jgi:hypothetical protein
VLGYVDDVILVPLGILAVVAMVPADVMAESRAAADAISERPVSHKAAAVIIAIWLVSVALTEWFAYRYFARS